MRSPSNPARHLRPALLRALAALALLLMAQAARADDQENTIPAQFQGTWRLRLTSADGGKTYLSGDNQPLCEVSAAAVSFLRKVDFAPEKLAVKSVAADEAGGRKTYRVTFENGKVWKLSENSGSITALLCDEKEGELTETFRITVRK